MGKRNYVMEELPDGSVREAVFLGKFHNYKTYLGQSAAYLIKLAIEKLDDTVDMDDAVQSIIGWQYNGYSDTKPLYLTRDEVYEYVILFIEDSAEQDVYPFTKEDAEAKLDEVRSLCIFGKYFIEEGA